MKSFSQFINESIQEDGRSAFTKLLTSELDRYGIKWLDRATPLQRKNGTSVISMHKNDAFWLFLESDWLEFEPRPSVKRRLLLLREKYRNGLDDILFKVNRALSRSATSSEWDNFIIYVYRNSFRGDFGGKPSTSNIVKFNPDDPSSLQTALASLLNYHVRPLIKIMLTHINYGVFWRLPTHAGELSSPLADEFVRQYGIESIVSRINDLYSNRWFDKGSVASNGPIDNFLKSIDLSQAMFTEILNDPTVPDEIKRSLEQNPNYSAPDDLLSDWF